MANQEHVDILKQGADIWNAWRSKNPEVAWPDLSYADLISTNLSDTNLNGANFTGANLRYANLSLASLGFANLTGANLHSANLSFTNLTGADLKEAKVGWTIFADVDLSMVKGLEAVEHISPSSIGIDTLYRSGGDIPEVFLRGTGIDDTFITSMRSLVGKSVEYNSCFISYSRKDEDFAKQLYADLQRKNVQCWLASENMKTGDRIRPRIHEQIWFNDKLLLILTESSASSEWVDYEVETALARERKEKRDILFPIRLDDAVKKSTAAWATHIQDVRHITDFTHWKEHDEYQKGLNRLLRDLKQDAIKDRQ